AAGESAGQAGTGGAAGSVRGFGPPAPAVAGAAAQSIVCGIRGEAAGARSRDAGLPARPFSRPAGTARRRADPLGGALCPATAAAEGVFRRHGDAQVPHVDPAWAGTGAALAVRPETRAAAV